MISAVEKERQAFTYNIFSLRVCCCCQQSVSILHAKCGDQNLVELFSQTKRCLICDGARLEKVDNGVDDGS